MDEDQMDVDEDPRKFDDDCEVEVLSFCEEHSGEFLDGSGGRGRFHGCRRALGQLADWQQLCENFVTFVTFTRDTPSKWGSSDWFTSCTFWPTRACLSTRKQDSKISFCNPEVNFRYD